MFSDGQRRTQVREKCLLRVTSSHFLSTADTHCVQQDKTVRGYIQKFPD